MISLLLVPFVGVYRTCLVASSEAADHFFHFVLVRWGGTAESTKSSVVLTSGIHTKIRKNILQSPYQFLFFSQRENLKSLPTSPTFDLDSVDWSLASH